jgi:hypothetical protein
LKTGKQSDAVRLLRIVKMEEMVENLGEVERALGSLDESEMRRGSRRNTLGTLGISARIGVIHRGVTHLGISAHIGVMRKP